MTREEFLLWAENRAQYSAQTVEVVTGDDAAYHQANVNFRIRFGAPDYERLKQAIERYERNLFSTDLNKEQK